MSTFIKDPDSTLDYEVDWSAWLGTDTISSVSWTVDSGLTQSAASNTTTAAKIWLSGGTVNTTYSVTCEIVTAGGRIDDRSFSLIIKER